MLAGSQDEKTGGREKERNIRRLISTRYRSNGTKRRTFALFVEVGTLLSYKPKILGNLVLIEGMVMGLAGGWEVISLDLDTF